MNACPTAVLQTGSCGSEHHRQHEPRSPEEY